MREKVAAIKAKRAAAAGGTAAAAAPAEVEAMESADPAMADAAAVDPAAADPAASEGAVAPHGPEAHTGGGVVGKAPMGPHEKFRAKFKGGRSRGGFGRMFSDIRLKEKIQRTGSSPSGIPIYEFNYIGDNSRYSGTMAQDLLETNPDAVSMDTSGYYKVNYSNIDVDMHLI